MDIKNLNQAVICKSRYDRLKSLIERLKSSNDPYSVIKESVSDLSETSIGELKNVVLNLLEEDKTALEKEIESL